MTKRKANTDENNQDPTFAKSKKPKTTKITLESDPIISTDHAKISELLSQKKTWRLVHSRIIFFDVFREIANYFQDYNTESIKKRYNLCRRVIMETFTPEDVLSPSGSKLM